MHLLIVTNHFYPENFRINDLAFGLVEKGHQVSVLTGLPNYPAGKIFPGYGIFRRRHETVKGVRVRRIPLIPRGRGRAINLLLNYLSSALCMCTLAPFVCREKYDAIFVFETSPVTIGLPAIVLKWLRRIPIVFWVLDLWPESLSATGSVRNRFLLGLVRRLVRFIYRHCDRILVSSRGFESRIREVGGYQGPIEYFPNWIEPEMLAPVRQEKAELPTLPDGFRIVFTGNIGVAQDFPTILSAAESLAEYSDLQWVIVGDGRQWEWTRAEVSRRKLESCVHLLGRFPLETMPWFYDAADALLLPLRNEPIFALTAPGKLQSYLASGKPVIASIEGEGAEMVRQARAGVTCQAENPQALAEAVLRLYRMPLAERRQLGANGQEFATRHFDRQMLFDQVEERLLAVVGRSEQRVDAGSR